jgi:hypothetical protein
VVCAHAAALTVRPILNPRDCRLSGSAEDGLAKAAVQRMSAIMRATTSLRWAMVVCSQLRASSAVALWWCQSFSAVVVPEFSSRVVVPESSSRGRIY